MSLFGKRTVLVPAGYDPLVDPPPTSGNQGGPSPVLIALAMMALVVAGFVAFPYASAAYASAVATATGTATMTSVPTNTPLPTLTGTPSATATVPEAVTEIPTVTRAWGTADAEEIIQPPATVRPVMLDTPIRPTSTNAPPQRVEVTRVVNQVQVQVQVQTQIVQVAVTRIVAVEVTRVVYPSETPTATETSTPTVTATSTETPTATATTESGNTQTVFIFLPVITR